jgi:ABC-2 type transport system permease protein
MREQFRDLTVLGLTVIFAPLFVYLYWLFFPSGSTIYGVLVINHDLGVQQSDGSTWNAGEEAIEALNAVSYADGQPLLKAQLLDSIGEAEIRLRERKGTAFVEIPADFSEVLLARQEGKSEEATNLVFGGDLTNPYYAVVAILATSAVDGYVQGVTGQYPVLHYDEQPLGASAARTEFETYAPGILIFAAIMLIFTASMTVTREVEEGTLRRLQISRMKAWEFMGGITMTLVVVGVVSVLLAFGTAIGLGFRSQGPVWVAMLIAALTSVSVIGVGMVVAAFSNTVARAFVIANFPLGFFMFFTGVIYPIPQVPLFTLAGRTVGLYDILPPTHAVVALNKIMNLGVGVEDVLYELGALLILSLVYFIIGVWIFHRRHMRVV